MAAAAIPITLAVTVAVKIVPNGIRYSGPVLTLRPGLRSCACSKLRIARCAGTNARSTTMSSLAVPRRPIESQTSRIS
ncbi:hypothetical protein [Actinomadura madurae]|uniref:hypothetical protein n=1 Tax=Actinomadura madurae TaxID=1993 RepID=UPI0020D25890|nr:hypothetical protein [Actinomadura madurae]MCQ0019315.1 hypothetical protein [Actinomadura madurae]